MSNIAIEDRKRLVWVFCSLFALFCLLILQFYRIQIIEGDKWTRIALSQHQFAITEPHKRGLFYSNTSIKKGHPEKPHPFVVDVPKFHLFADPSAIPQEYREEIATQIITILQLQEKDGKKVEAGLAKKSRSRKLILWLDHHTKEELQKWWLPFARSKKIPRNALFFIQDYKRSYPFGTLLGQVLHTVREEKDKNTHARIPTGGLELIFNRFLSGTDGKRLLLRSPRHPLDMDKVVCYPEDGADIYLTINHYLQAVAEEEIAEAVKKANAKSGWAIMMDPSTGEILALAQYPFFDPTHYQDYYNNDKLKEHTKLKALTDAYEPGSTFKPITIAVALKANEELKKRGKPPLFSPLEKIATHASLFPGRSTPIKDTHSHAFLNMYLAMQKSSNVYMARLVQRILSTLGEKWYRDTLHDLFGFGEKTGIELPSETAGLLPTPGKMHPNGALEWSTPTPYSLAFGHNILVNSFQMLRSYAILATGYDVKPTLIRKMVKHKHDGTQMVLIDNTTEERKKSFTRILEPSICNEVVSAMKLVTKPGGTASKAEVYGYTEAGKTGTSEKIVKGNYSKNVHFSSFIGIAPAKNPKIVLMIAIDEPESKYIPGIGKNQHGGNCAAPAFAGIATRTLQYLGVEPDDPHGYPVGDPRRDSEKADMMKQVKELKELYMLWNGK